MGTTNYFATKKGKKKKSFIVVHFKHLSKWSINLSVIRKIPKMYIYLHLTTTTVLRTCKFSKTLSVILCS